MIRSEYAENSVSAQKILKIDELLAHISHLCENRFHAISYYPNSRGAQERFETVALIRYELGNIRAMLNYRFQVIACLRLENALMSLAPSPVKKLHATYVFKVKTQMDYCRAYLKRISQS